MTDNEITLSYNCRHCTDGANNGVIDFAIEGGTPPIVVNISGSRQRQYVVDSVPYKESLDNLPAGRYRITARSRDGQSSSVDLALEKEREQLEFTL